MNAATHRRDDARTTRMLRIDPGSNQVEDFVIGDLRTLLHEGDLLVVNDAATHPASLHGTAPLGRSIEIRLAGELEAGRWRAVVFGPGDFRTPTEHRAPPPAIQVSDLLDFGLLHATVREVDAVSPRLLVIEFAQRGETFWRRLYHNASFIQYAYVPLRVSPWDVSTPYASRPWACEAASAGFAFTWDLLLGLRRRGVRIATLTHAAGLSSTGDPTLDARLPFPERYDIPAATVAAVEATKRQSRDSRMGAQPRGRVIAVGTTVARALEGAADNHGGELRSGQGVTGLKLGPNTVRRVVDGILTGVHDVEASHFTLLEAFAPRKRLLSANAHAEARGYVGHEFGDLVLVLP